MITCPVMDQVQDSGYKGQIFVLLSITFTPCIVNGVCIVQITCGVLMLSACIEYVTTDHTGKFVYACNMQLPNLITVKIYVRIWYVANKHTERSTV